MIEFQRVCYTFQQSFTSVLEGISFRIERGECIGLLGPSGSGKSTIARIAAGFLLPTKGRVIIDGRDMSGRPSRKVMLLNQESDLFPWQTVEHHVRFAIREKNPLRIQELIDLVHLRGHEKKYPNQLSGGMKKRLSLARALAVNPAVLILDEAFSSLDSRLKNILYADLKEIWEKLGTTIILITHDRGDVDHFAQRIFELSGKPAHLIEVQL